MSENITPAYREEKLLANIAGEDYDITPATRKEKLLAEIAAGGGGLPDTSDADVGDVLTVGEDGNAEWSAPSGGLPEAPYSSGSYYLMGAVYDDGGDIDIGWNSVPMGTVNEIVINTIKIVLLPFLESGLVRNLRLITCQGTQSELSVTLETAYRPNNNNLSSSVEILGINRTQQKVAKMQITNNGLIIITNIDGAAIDASDRFYFTGVY